MTQQEFTHIAKAIKTYYPRENILPNAEAVALWFNELNDIEYQDAVAAIREHVRTSPYSPTIADIRKTVTEQRLEREHILTAQEAWELVRDTMKYAGRPEDARRMFEDMPEDVQKCIGSYKVLNEWALMTDLNVSVLERMIKGNYEELMKARKKKEQAGDVSRNKLKGLAEKTVKQLGGGKNG